MKRALYWMPFVLFGLIIVSFLLSHNTEAATITVDDSGGADYTHIQWAIDNASSGDTIEVHSGNYFGTVWINKTISLIGEGSGSTIIDGMGQNVVVINGDWVNVTGFTISNSTDDTDNVTYGVLVNSDNTNISYNIISWNEIGLYIRWTYVEDTNDNNTIYANNVSHNRNGIELSKSKNNMIINNHVSYTDQEAISFSNSGNGLIQYNNVSNNNGTGISVGGEGSVNCRISDNYVSSNKVTGLKLSNINNALVENNSIKLNGRSGVSINDGSNITISNNNISFNEVGLNIWEHSDTNGGSSDVKILNNYISNNNDSGLNCFGQDHTISNNTIYQNGGYGLWLNRLGGGHIVESNSISHNNLGIISWAANCSITHNNIYKNVESGMVIIHSNNTISRNLFASNGNITNFSPGLRLTGGSGNYIYLNNFINDSTFQETEEDNFWYKDGVGNFYHDYYGTDSDGDGVGDTPQTFHGINDPYPMIAIISDVGRLPLADSDGDGCPDLADAFPDDPDEYVDSDFDGIGDNEDPDDDNDGLPDEWELKYGMNPKEMIDASEDWDGDGASNFDEFKDDTDPTDPKSVSSSDGGPIGFLYNYWWLLLVFVVVGIVVSIVIVTRPSSKGDKKEDSETPEKDQK